MTQSETTRHTASIDQDIAGRIARILDPIVGGELPVHLRAWDGSTAGPIGQPEVQINSANALRRLLWSPGELGAAQAYVTGEVDVPGSLDDALTHLWNVVASRDLTMPKLTPSLVLQLTKLARELGVFGPPLPAPASQAKIKGRLHSLLRDREAISHHYDLSNSFYELILDDHMAYSCGYWLSDDPDYTLEDAQRDKLDQVCRKIGLDTMPGQRFLDVGCGWGSLSLFAAEHFGAKVTGVTISKEQKAFIDQRIAERGLQDRVEIRLQDYREVSDGPYDAVASLEMGEHVGEENYGTYTSTLFRNVRPGGKVLIQQMSRHGKNPGGGPFIESFIAPDMHMRSVGDTINLIENAGFEIRGVEAMREHYVHTIDAWHDRFEANWDQAVEMMGEEVARVWRLYLVGASMTFRDGRMGVDQILSQKPLG
ncbi:cyclopropane-fatty-acyl-phospholipid synthase family protein [Arthrobacter sp. CAN_C5]|uniref:SAM-dependent methyltransferase n=1 Tax=Arthrobacter sp. CAN_C5 TaxID=2760706 RepID=UPI001FDAC4FF|nr:cyclopropane-fatty-acyl-phospholipid synthase family protein [Arthrobacter sp. CAN_C5]MBP2217247.1 cyclopropane-fatty-acyl-phospholipid synthase [Arthrobacter sp. CAN_C5]